MLGWKILFRKISTMKVQITGLSVQTEDDKPFSVKFNGDDPWIFEVDHHSQMNKQLNEIRDIATKIFRAKYGSKILIHLFHKRM